MPALRPSLEECRSPSHLSRAKNDSPRSLDRTAHQLGSERTSPAISVAAGRLAALP